MEKAIIIGATSGIGRALSKELVQRHYMLGLAGRNEEQLAVVQRELAMPAHAHVLDVSDPDQAEAQLTSLIAALGGMDLLVLSSGIGDRLGEELAWENEARVLAVNIQGFARMAVYGYNYFARKGGGHLVGISSMAGIRGSRTAPAYSASKAFQMNYLEALRGRARHQRLPITVTDIRPGFVNTPMTRGQQGMFWVAEVERAARQIADAIIKKRRVAHITRRWALIAWLLRHAPDWLVERY